MVHDSTRLLNREWRSLTGKKEDDRPIPVGPIDREIRGSDLRRPLKCSSDDDVDDDGEVFWR